MSADFPDFTRTLRKPKRVGDIVTIDDIQYAGSLFEQLALAAIGSSFQIVGRNDGVIILRALPDWQPIETAPMPAYKPDGYNGYWHCLLQDQRGYVGEGWGYWVPPRRGSTKGPLLRWANKIGQCFPKYWMPLPAPKQETTSTVPEGKSNECA